MFTRTMKDFLTIHTLIALTLAGCIPERDGQIAQRCVGAECEPDTGVSDAGVPPAACRHELLKVDYLFVIDNSASMCEHQAQLADSFRTLSKFLFRNEDPSDFRLAVVSTDMDPRNPDRAKFLSQSAPYEPTVTCSNQDGSPYLPQTAGCDELHASGEIKPIMKPSEIETFEEASNYFRCMSQIGTAGGGLEMGLESMRTALSCAGPNRDRLGDCCIDGEEGATWNPACSEGPLENGVAPQFLRPDALLVVVFLSDENDCSHPDWSGNGPSLNPICRHGEIDNDADGIPDGFDDAALCNGEDASTCYRTFCGADTPSRCAGRSCGVALSNFVGACEWERDRLVPVADYVDFLRSLKADPDRQVIISSKVGPALLDPNGNPLRFTEPDGTRLPCDIDPDTDGARSRDCCADGECQSVPFPSCSMVNDTGAFDGYRYRELADAFRGNVQSSLCGDTGMNFLSEVQARVDEAVRPLCEVY